MQNISLKRSDLVLLLAMVSCAWTSLRGQTSTAPLQVTGPSPTNFEFRADGTMIVKGATGTGSLLSTDQGAGTRLLWYPALGAFRAGTVSGTFWDLPKLGQYSVALGNNTTASGAYSAAFGSSSTASGQNAFAAGYITTASGSGSSAMGWFATASGAYSVAMGNGAGATGNSSVALGSAKASGNSSVALGCSTAAAADYSTAMGAYNLGGGIAGTLAPTDPILEVGNGAYRALSDAFVVYRNGSAAFQGAVTVAAGGDIPMYTGN